MKTAVKAFGKVLVFGSYAILEPGNIGLVVNVDKGTTVTIKDYTDGVLVEIPHLNINVTGRYTGENNSFAFDEGNLELQFLAYALTYAGEHLMSKGITPKPMHIVSVNDPSLGKEKKTGLGSSSTATVSAVAAILKFHDIDDRSLVHKISCFSHRMAQGRLGSGYDVFAACFGSHFFTGTKQKLDEHFLQCMAQDWNMERDHFTWPKELFPVLIFSGKSASTKRMVEKVLTYRRKNKTTYAQFMEEYNTINIALQKAFKENNPKEIISLLEQSWKKRKELGPLAGITIESDAITELLDEMKSNGALTAGLAGAGGGDTILALCSLEKEKQQLLTFVQQRKLEVFEDVHFYDEGYVFSE